MAKKNTSRSQSRSTTAEKGARRTRTASGFDSRRTLGPVATLLVRALATRDRSLADLVQVHSGARRALRSLIDRGLVLERTVADSEVRFALSTEARRSVVPALRRARATSGVAVVVTGVAVRDGRRSRRSLTFKQ
jgi:hypothetical protein